MMQGKHWRILRKELVSTTRFLRKKENLYREIKLWIFEVADFVVTCDFIYLKKKGSLDKLTCLVFRDYNEILEKFPNKSTLKMQILVLSRRIDEEN